MLHATSGTGITAGGEDLGSVKHADFFFSLSLPPLRVFNTLDGKIFGGLERGTGQNLQRVVKEGFLVASSCCFYLARILYYGSGKTWKQDWAKVRE